MMPVIRISDSTFGNLRVLADWLGVDKPSAVIDSILAEKMESIGIVGEHESRDLAGEMDDGKPFLFEQAPGLSFTKPLSAVVNGETLVRPGWAGVLKAVVKVLREKGNKRQELVAALEIPASISRLKDHGYKYHPDLGISYQGQAAADAWKEIARIADKHSIPVSVEFRWRDDPRAERPGRSGILKAGDT